MADIHNGSDRMTDLFRRLNGVGMNQSYVKSTALPEWWSAAVANSTSGYDQTLLLLSRHLGLSLSSLRSSGVPEFRNTESWKYHRQVNATPQDVQVTSAICFRIAQMVAAGVQTPVAIPSDAGFVRDEILGRGAPWVSYGNLVQFCWANGIPVVHVRTLPKRAGKIAGMVTVIDGRPVIILSKSHKHSAWLLFVLAHELGHIICGHVANGDALIEDHDLSEGVDDDNEQEKEATGCGLHIITGSKNRRIQGPKMPATALARAASKYGSEFKVDPGHVALNYSNSLGTDFYGLGNAALNILEPKADAGRIATEAMFQHFDWSCISDDSADFLTRAVGKG
ncbi:MAG: hypothetical protein ACI8P0_003053 [Planctomycetaceae bacterium]|jgi:hypothetical protein